MRVWVWLAVSGLAMVGHNAHAGCGLGSCSRLEVESVQERESSVRVGVPDVVHITGYDLEGQQGTYVEDLLGVELLFNPGWFVSVKLPFVVVLPDDSETRMGLGNIVVSGAGRGGPSERLRWSGGLKVELPTGQSKQGVSANHWVMTPHASVSSDLGVPVGAFTVGWLQSLGGNHDHSAGASDGTEQHDDVHNHEHDHEASATSTGGSEAESVPLSPVNPHEASELLMRLTLGVDVMDDFLRTEVLLDSQTVMEGPNAGAMHLYTGPSLTMHFNETWTASVGATLPLTKVRRYDWRTFVGAMATF